MAYACSSISPRCCTPKRCSSTISSHWSGRSTSTLCPSAIWRNARWWSVIQRSSPRLPAISRQIAFIPKKSTEHHGPAPGDGNTERLRGASLERERPLLLVQQQEPSRRRPHTSVVRRDLQPVLRQCRDILEVEGTTVEFFEILATDRKPERDRLNLVGRIDDDERVSLIRPARVREHAF